MNPESEKYLRDHFVEEVALALEREGLPRMTGRVFGHLLICEPTAQSSADLAEALQASRGAISQSTRALIGAGLIQRVPKPGSRKMYFEVTPDSFDTLLHASVARIAIMRELSEKGLALLADRPAEQAARLRAFRDMFAFMEQHYPALIERWDQRRKES
jgi:DNA-binding transcriptional regulator GbsR (MarR family)